MDESLHEGDELGQIAGRPRAELLLEDGLVGLLEPFDERSATTGRPQQGASSVVGSRDPFDASIGFEALELAGQGR